MEVLSIRNEKERKRMLELCANLWEKRALIPVLGAGFSLGTPTDNNGAIPSVSELHSELYKYIVRYSKYDQEDIKELEKTSLSDLASSFWDIFKRIPDDEIKEFYKYFDRNFQSISFFKDFQKEFLNISWPYLFTLNYDSLIENYSRKYYSVIPFDKINKHFAKEKSKLFKLHGDVKRYLQTGDKKYLILSRDQYIQSLLSDSNKDMLDELLTTFSSKSILFFGCGLTEELDLLYSSQINLAEKAKSINSDRQSIIYISFESDEMIANAFSKRKQDVLARYGVTTVLRISSEDESAAFFKELGEYTSRIPQSSIESFLEKYSAMQYKTLKISDAKCRDFLFQESLVWESFSNHIITLPGYSVDRDSLPSVIDFISNDDSLCFVSGNFFCGKTIFLLEIARCFSQKKVYIFPSGTNLTDEQLDVLAKKNNALLCFDTKSLTTAQIRIITRNSSLADLKKRGTSIVIVIDKSDAPMYKYIFEARNIDKEFKMFSLASRFSNNEEKDFNTKIGAISLPPYIRKETILDYVVNNEKKLLGSLLPVGDFLEPNRELLSRDTQRRVQALIMLATEIRIPAKRAIQFKIDSAINDIINCCSLPGNSSVIEKDYSVYNGDSSGYEYVCNSRYWVIRALSSFAKQHSNSIGIISDAYVDIIKAYRSIYSSNDILFYQNCEPYYFFDHIQVLFNQRWFSNSSKLMNVIYDKLLQQLSNSYQFMHQKAKGKLVIAQVQIKNREYYAAKQALKDAVFNIVRADELASQYPDAKNIDETLLHMAYTKGRIYIEYSCISTRYIPQAVEACYQLYQMQQNVQHDVYDFAKSAGNDRWAFKKFKDKLMLDPNVKKISDLDIDKANFLLSHWTGKNVSLSKKELVSVK